MEDIIWKRSSFCHDQTCVELGWRRSSLRTTSECVEIRAEDDLILVRDSNDPDGPVLRFTRAELAAWIQGCKAGEFDDLC